MAESPTRWRAAFEIFEELMPLDDAAREARLQQIESRQPQLGQQLRHLLSADALARTEAFLEPRTAGPLPVAGDYGLQAGQGIGPFELIESLGRGGMGEVWRARRADGLYDTPVALKLLHLHLAGTAMRARFLREGRILGQFTHPHIAQLLDAGVSDATQPWLALEFVDGQRLDQWCEQRRLSVRARLELFLQVCAAVSHAHAHLVVHRDIKPSNVLVTGEGQVKLLDFGIAKLVEEQSAAAAETELTRFGGRVLTPEYAAPEQITGSPVTVATDVYALGVTLYVLLTGVRPYGEGAATPAQLERDILETEPPPPSRLGRLSGDTASARSTTPERLRAELSGDLDTVVLKALKKIPAERYASVAALAEDLRRYLNHEPLLARPDTWTYRARKYIRRHRGGVATGAAVSIALIAGVAGTFWQSRIANAYADRARQRADELAKMVEFQGEMLTRVDVAQLGPALFAQMQDNIRNNLQRQRRPDSEQSALSERLAALEPLADAPEAARQSLATHLLAPAELQIERLADTPSSEVAMRRSLADGYSALGLPQRALEQLDRALEAHERLAPALDPVVSTRNALELRYRRAEALGKLDRIEDFSAESAELVKAFDASFGPDELPSLRARRLAGKALFDDGKLEEARAWTQDLIQRQTARFGADHPETLESRSLMFSIVYELDELDMPEFGQALLSDSERVHGMDHPQTQRAYIQMGHALYQRARYAEAATYYRPAYESRKRTSGGDHMETLIVLANLGSALNANNEPEEGEPYLAEAWTKLRAHLGDDHQYTQVVGSNYAMRLRRSGRAEQAVPIMESIVNMRQAVLGEEHPRTLYARNNLALAMAQAGQGEAALAIHDEAIAIQSRVLGPMHHGTLAGRVLRCDTLAAMGRAGEASRSFEALIVDVEAEFGRDSDRYRNMVEEYIGHLEERGASREAERARQRYGTAPSP